MSYSGFDSLWAYVSDITVYGSASCVPCRNTKRYLDAWGLEYNYIDVTKDQEALDKITELGYSGIPVIMIDGYGHWQGFDLERLEQLINY